jgi:hypothetical protein
MGAYAVQTIADVQLYAEDTLKAVIATLGVNIGKVAVILAPDLSATSVKYAYQDGTKVADATTKEVTFKPRGYFIPPNGTASESPDAKGLGLTFNGARVIKVNPVVLGNDPMRWFATLAHAALRIAAGESKDAIKALPESAKEHGLSKVENASNVYSADSGRTIYADLWNAMAGIGAPDFDMNALRVGFHGKGNQRVTVGCAGHVTDPENDAYKKHLKILTSSETATGLTSADSIMAVTDPEGNILMGRPICPQCAKQGVATALVVIAEMKKTAKKKTEDAPKTDSTPVPGDEAAAAAQATDDGMPEATEQAA